MIPKVHSNFGMKLHCDFDKNVEVWVDNFEEIETSKADVKFYVQIEPNEIINLNNGMLYISNKNLVDYIFTYEEDVLSKSKKAILFEYGTCWISPDDTNFNKTFSISTICGNKEQTDGHRMRKKLWYKQHKIKTPTKFFMSKYGGLDNINENPILADSKLPLFESMFHICIENSKKDYYFSEKIIDCFLAKTIPIYWGANKISDYFNINGFYIVNSIEEIISVCNSLTESDYKNKIDIIEENFTKAKNWINFDKRLEDKIRHLIQ